MKAAQIVSYNKNNIALTVTDVPAPRPAAQQVLVKISTAGVNPLDNMISRGEVKLITPYALPQIAGNEIVGRVEALGEGVTSFKVGERVFARLPLNSIGAFADRLDRHAGIRPDGRPARQDHLHLRRYRRRGCHGNSPGKGKGPDRHH